ncbi:MAG: tol-pal system protein YbgF [Deltaproteobacteria bacterium]|nr:tol-pal system protein YbgF [Deltaproteobacteria bacterium]
MSLRRKSRIGTTKLLLMVFLTAVVGGCASTQETSTLQQNVSTLYDRVQSLEKRLDGMDTQGKKSADNYSRMEELRMRMGALSGRIDELEHKLQQLSRASSAVQPAPKPQPEGDVASSEAVPPIPGEGTAGVSVSLPPEPVSPEKALYDKASELYQQGKYDLARKEFQTLASKYPKSELADNALFSVGECHFAEKKYQDAIEVYQQVLDRYPKGDRIPHALLKQGTAFQQMGDPTAARILYERLLEKYPDSPQAQIAKKKLKQMP